MNHNSKLVLHVDCCSPFFEMFDGQKIIGPLNLTTLNQIKNLNSIQILTIKATSLITADILNHLPQLQLIVTRTVGTDHIDLATCQQRKIVVKNLPDYGSFAIAEHILALLLSVTRKVIQLSQQTQAGHFSLEDARGWTLASKQMGIIGMGKIGQELAKLALAFQMKIVFFDVVKNKSVVSLPELLATSDVISLNLPLTAKTKHLINDETIQQMKTGVILINTARGGVIDTASLIKNMDKFSYVLLDVLEDEANFSKQHPLLQFSKVIITPHCAFFTDQTSKTIVASTNQIIKTFIQERKKHI